MKKPVDEFGWEYDIDDLFKVMGLQDKFNVNGVIMDGRTCINFLGIELEDIHKETSTEVRRNLITFYGVARFLRDGGAEEVLSAKTSGIKDDYEGARLLRLKFDNEEVFYVEMINQTIEPGAEDMNEEQRLSAGLTPEGQKKYYNIMPREQAKLAKSMWDVEAWTFGKNLDTKTWEGVPKELMPFFDFDTYRPEVEA